jgi:hypothetical protein
MSDNSLEQKDLEAQPNDALVAQNSGEKPIPPDEMSTEGDAVNEKKDLAKPTPPNMNFPEGAIRSCHANHRRQRGMVDGSGWLPLSFLFLR